MIVVEAPASSANLGPGFDALALAWQLRLRVALAPADGDGDELHVSGEGEAEIRLGPGNRFVAGFERGLAELGVKRPPMRIDMDNQIPLGRGLGSSAAACVAGLLAGWALAGAPIDQTRLLALAAAIEGHADNAAAALLGGFVIVSTDERGDTQAARFDAPPALVAALFIPDLPLSTEQMRAVLPATVTHADAARNNARTALVTAALTSGRLELLAAMAGDRLHEPYRAVHFPQLRVLREAATAAGALGAALSGAGSTVVALTGDEPRAHAVAQAMAAAAVRSGLAGRSLVVRPAQAGATIVAGGR